MLKCKNCENWKKETHFKPYKGKEIHICAEKDELTCEDDTCTYAKSEVEKRK